MLRTATRSIRSLALLARLASLALLGCDSPDPSADVPESLEDLGPAQCDEWRSGVGQVCAAELAAGDALVQVASECTLDALESSGLLVPAAELGPNALGSDCAAGQRPDGPGVRCYVTAGGEHSTCYAPAGAGWLVQVRHECELADAWHRSGVGLHWPDGCAVGEPITSEPIEVTCDAAGCYAPADEQGEWLIKVAAPCDASGLVHPPECGE